jgi:hypothetical protein
LPTIQPLRNLTRRIILRMFTKIGTCMRRTLIAPAICLALVANALLTGWLGLDFGGHWDEWYALEGVSNGIKDLSILPREYTYSGMYFNIGFLLLIPHVLRLLPGILQQIAANPTRPLEVDQYPALVSAKSQLLALVQEPGFLLDLRAAYLAIAALTIVWVYLVLRRLFPGQVLAAAAGTGFIACSWEAAYHSRFVAVDSMLMQFAALTFLLIAEALFRRDPARIAGWLAAAAAAAGAGFGSKLTGVFMIVPVLTAACVHPDLRLGPRSRVALIAGLSLVFGFSFFVTTPGSLLDPIRFAAAIIYEGNSYNHGPVLPFHVTGPANHLWLMAVWLFAVVPSPATALALPMSAVTALGFHTLWRRQRPFFWCIAAYVLFLVAFFLTFTHQLLVRNALVFVPLMAVAFGAGVLTLDERVRRRKAGVLVPLGVAAALLYNIVWLWIAAVSIYRSDTAAYAGKLLDYMAARPSEDFRLSRDVLAELKSPPRLKCEDSGTPASGNSHIVFMASEPEWDQWLANHLGFFETTITSLEINYDYYPTWYGKNFKHRIEVLSADNARKMYVDFAQFQRCKVQP